MRRLGLRSESENKPFFLVRFSGFGAVVDWEVRERRGWEWSMVGVF